MNKVTEAGKTRRIQKLVHPSSDSGHVKMTSGEQRRKRRCALNHGKVSQDVEESGSLFIPAGMSALLNGACLLLTLLTLFFYFYFFNINLFNWRLITLQYCSGFAVPRRQS